MPAVALDKQFAGHVAPSYGTIQIRVVVLKVGADARDEDVVSDSPGEAEAISEESTASPLAAYMERKKYGKQCVVFLVGGQRHDTLDSTFISRDLGFKYLRNRTMIIVDLDGLAPEAIAEIVQGSRQGLYQGHVMGAITDRLVGTLRKDPDLVRLQEEEEQRIAELQAGDEVVREKLDELIDAHHSAATHTERGGYEAGEQRSAETRLLVGQRGQNIVIQGRHDQGDASTLPVLTTLPSTSLRLQPNAESGVRLESMPPEAWVNLEAFDVRLDPAVNEMTVTVDRTEGHALVKLLFSEPAGFDREEYPIETTFRATAKFKGHEEVRVVERTIVVRPKRAVPPPPPPVLRPDPTFLRVVSRQPVKLLSGGAATHVRLCWDGEDSLAAGSGASWAFSAKCRTLETFPSMGFSQPKNGRFELLLDTPRGLLSGHTLEFDVRAIGPGGRILEASFTGIVTETPSPPEPRRLHSDAPEPAAQRRPPYELRIVRRADWSAPTCWGESTWTEADVGSYKEPTDSTPLTLIINDDAADLVMFRDALVKRQLDETTVKERVNRYTAHVAFHLYQMFRFKKERREQQSREPDVPVPREDDERLEIRRVATTLLMLMEVSLRSSS